MIKKSFSLPVLDPSHLQNIAGVDRQNLRYLEKTLAVGIELEAETLSITSNANTSIQNARRCVQMLTQYADTALSTTQIHQLLENGDIDPIMSPTIKLGRKTISPRNEKQRAYLESIEKNAITFAIGPAGTGKTWLAVAKAIEAFERGDVARLIFVRPAVEAGEKLGFLPGDLVEKVLPYLRPIYDALYEMLGFKETQKLIDRDVIEILPLAFMRGRTLNEAFIILDEAQNTSQMQMKMFVTRMGFSSKMVINGDMTQVDLPKETASGLSHATSILRGIAGIDVFNFTTKEVIRHPLIGKIIDCYEQNGADNER